MLRAVFIFFAVLHAAYLPVHAQFERTTFHDEEKKQVKEIFQVQDTISNILNGKYISYHINGNIESQGYFKNNNTIGVWEFYFETGTLKMRGDLEEASSDGYWEYFYENGQKRMEGRIEDQKREGPWKFYFESGELKEAGNYQNNKREGLWVLYYEDGKQRAEIDYTYGSGQMVEYYPSGEKKAEGPKLGTDNVGQWTFYHKNGNKEAAGMYENSRKVGDWEFYYETGELSTLGAYDGGQPNGDWVYYYPDGTVKSRGEFNDGQKSGYWGVFHENGELKGETTFKNGIGTYREYYPSGNVKVKGTIVNGLNEGKWEYFYEGGDVEGTVEFEKGKGAYYGYYPDGTLQTKGTIDNGKRTGRWELYDQQGKLSGYYKPVYDAKIPESKTVVEKNKKYGVGAYRFKGQRFKYFKKKINEFEGVILAFNPLGSFIGRVPFAVEFYKQERLGHEFEFEGIRDPFFQNDNDIPLNDTYTRGYSMAFKQKFYNVATDYGLWYFGHEIRFSNLSHFANIESVLIPDDQIKVSANEQKIEYSVMLGYRLMQSTVKKGFTIDAFFSAGTGYRNFDVTEGFDAPFDELRQSKVPFRMSFGLNMGYVFSFGRGK